MELRHRYSATGMGFAWHIIHPLTMIGLYSIIFGVFLERAFEGLNAPYPLFLCAGLIPWFAFSESLTNGLDSFRANAAYLKRLPVPEQAFIAQTALTSTLHLGISFTLLLCAALVFGHTPTWHWLLIPVPLLLMQGAAFGIGLTLGTLNVFFPDINQFVQLLIRFAFWLAPILFPFSFFEQHGLGLLALLNPVTVFLLAVRDLFISGALPSVETVAGMLFWTVGSVAVGFSVLNALRSEIRDQL